MDVLLLAPVSPFDPRDGHRLAVLSDVLAIVDNGLRLGVIAFSHDDETTSTEPVCEHKFIPVRSGGFASRLLRGLFRDVPPSAERLYSDRAQREVRQALLDWKPPVVIIDDSLVAGYVPLIRDVLPRTKVVLRSHNVMHDVRLEQARRTKGLTKPLIRFDCEKYLAFERQAVKASDAHWAITPADAERMTALYAKPTACLTVSLPLEKYESLVPEQGQSNAFVHVGTLDFRRRLDLSQFLNVSWPKVLQADPSATLMLAGTLHGSAIAASNVSYSGRVTSDTEVYRLGRFAVNFQSSTGGLKLKTLTSLAANRILVSTPAGVEGLPIQSGQHYWDIDSFVASPQLRELLRDCRASQSIADAGRQYVLANHSRASTARQFRKLLDDI
jgi:hypothetical protein